MPLWSKLESGRIPQPGELLQIIGKPTNRSINQFCCFLLTNAPAGLGGYQSCHDEIVIHVMFNILLAAGCRKPHQDGIRRCGRGRRRPGPDWGLQPRRVVVNQWDPDIINQQQQVIFRPNIVQNSFTEGCIIILAYYSMFVQFSPFSPNSF